MLGYNGVFWAHMGSFQVFGGERGVWGEKGCQGYKGVFGAQMGCFEAFGGVKGCLGGVRGCRRHNGVSGAQMRHWPWGERGVWWVNRGVWGEKGCLVAKSGCLGYIFFSTKVPWGTKQVPRVPESPV